MDFTFKIITYGCKVNQYESQSLREYWKSIGGIEFFDAQNPDIILLSACAVTAQGVSDARQMVRKLLRDSPESKVIVTGCAASAEPDDFVFENVVACIAQTAKWNLLYRHPLDLCKQISRKVSSEENISEMNQPNLKYTEYTECTECAEKNMSFPKNETEYPEFSIQDFERSRPVLKIQDGCSHGCTYCIVPFTRGRARSRNLGESLAEFSCLIKKGFREIVISGINLRQYHFKEQGAQGSQNERGNFWGFLRRLHKHVQEENLCIEARNPLFSTQKNAKLGFPKGIIPFGGEFERQSLSTRNDVHNAQSPIRIRLSSLEPSQIDQEGLETLEELSVNNFLCPHLHLSLQSGAEGVLKRMGREHYAPETIIDSMQKIRSFWPTLALGADFLMGFAGETEEELQETLNLVEALPLTYAHVFPYSIRPKTKAASLKGHLEKKVRQEHARHVRERIEQKKRNFMQSMLDLESMYISLDCAHERELPSNVADNVPNNVTDNERTHIVDTNRKLIGWNEFYVSCQIDLEHANIKNKDILQKLACSHELIQVKPIKIIDDKLVTSLV